MKKNPETSSVHPPEKELEKKNKYEQIVKEAVIKGEWKEEGFDLQESLNNTKGPLVEIGGPTSDGYNLIDINKLKKKVLTSNLFPGAPKFSNPDDTEFDTLNFYGKVDFMADAHNLPLQDNLTGAVFVSCLGGEHFKDLAVELKDKKFKPSSHINSAIPSEEERQRGIIIKSMSSNFYEPGRYAKMAKQKRILREGSMREALRVLEPNGLLVWQGGEVEDLEFATQNGFEPVILNKRNNNIFYNQVYRKILQNPDQSVSKN